MFNYLGRAVACAQIRGTVGNKLRSVRLKKKKLSRRDKSFILENGDGLHYMNTIYLEWDKIWRKIQYNHGCKQFCFLCKAWSWKLN